MLASLKSSRWPVLAAVLGFAGGYRVHAAVPGESPRERGAVVTWPQAPTPAVAVASPAVAEGERSGGRAAAMFSGVVSGGEVMQPLPAY
jgi:hypothetical protein